MLLARSEMKFKLHSTRVILYILSPYSSALRLPFRLAMYIFYSLFIHFHFATEQKFLPDSNYRTYYIREAKKKIPSRRISNEANLDDRIENLK